jgi:S-adenosylmethionine-diacylglycerol 3-amino-3-carboxypropyl transferase
VIFRSAHARPRYLDTTIVDGVRLSDRLVFHEELARELTRQDRVHTYAGFHICDVPA